jgi:hypothetical protein
MEKRACWHTPPKPRGTKSNQNPHKAVDIVGLDYLLTPPKSINRGAPKLGTGNPHTPRREMPPGRIDSRRPSKQWINSQLRSMNHQNEKNLGEKNPGTNRSPAVAPAAEKGWRFVPVLISSCSVRRRPNGPENQPAFLLLSFFLFVSLFLSFWFMKLGSVRWSVAIRYESRRFKWCDLVRFGHRERFLKASFSWPAGSLCWNWLGGSLWLDLPLRVGPQKRRVSGWVDPICVASCVAGCLLARHVLLVENSTWRCARWQLSTICFLGEKPARRCS